jgi:hypothetical protein
VRWQYLAGGTALVWLASWLWLTRYYQLDDAFITLKYACNLATHRFLTFDGLSETYGASSLLYVFLVAHLLPIIPTPETTKVLSVVSYVTLCILIIYQVLRDRQRSNALLWWILLVVLVSPMGVRWLSDGMETSLAALVAFGLAMIARLEAKRPPSIQRYPLLVAFGGMTELLRPEFAILIAAATIAIIVGDWGGRVRAPGAGLTALPRVAMARGHLMVGAILAISTSYYTLGQLLPDTAVAKAQGFAVSLARLKSFEPVFGGSLFFGMGLLILWAFSGLQVLRFCKSAERLGALAVNLGFPILAVTGWLRGQNMQIRYFTPSLIFACAWNLRESIPLLTRRLARLAPYRWAFVALIALEFCFEGQIAFRICNSSAHAIAKMQSEHLYGLAGENGVAGDIGMISYFSGGRVCDLGGLVEGHAWALSSLGNRLQVCAGKDPKFAYLDDDQIMAFSKLYPLGRMRKCYQYSLGNMSGVDTHYLFVSQSLAARVCGIKEVNVQSRYMNSRVSAVHQGKQQL